MEKISDKIKSNKGKNKKPLQELTAEKMKVRAKKMDKERILTEEELDKVTGGAAGGFLAAIGAATVVCGTAASDAGTTATVSNSTLSSAELIARGFSDK